MGAYRWLVVAAMGCSAPARPPAPATASPTPSCRATADRLFAPDDWNDFGPRATATMRGVIEARCGEDHWSEQSQICFRTMQHWRDSVRCNSLLTVSQKAAVERDLKKLFPRTGEPAPDDSIATTRCSIASPIIVKTWSALGLDLCRAAGQGLALVTQGRMLVLEGVELRVLLTSLVATETGVACKVAISLRADSELLGWLNGSARVDGTGPSAERDCVDAVVEDLITTKLGRLLKRRAGQFAGGAGP